MQASGRTVYFGNADNAVAFFERYGNKAPLFVPSLP